METRYRAYYLPCEDTNENHIRNDTLLYLIGVDDVQSLKNIQKRLFQPYTIHSEVESFLQTLRQDNAFEWLCEMFEKGFLQMEECENRTNPFRPIPFSREKLVKQFKDAGILLPKQKPTMDLKLYYLEVYDAKYVEKTLPMVSDSKKKVYRELLHEFRRIKLRSVYPQLISHLSEEQSNFDLNHRGDMFPTQTSVQLLGDLLTVYCKDVMKTSSEITVEDVKLAFKKYSRLIGLDITSGEEVNFIE